MVIIKGVYLWLDMLGRALSILLVLLTLCLATYLIIRVGSFRMYFRKKSILRIKAYTGILYLGTLMKTKLRFTTILE